MLGAEGIVGAVLIMLLLSALGLFGVSLWVVAFVRLFQKDSGGPLKFFLSGALLMAPVPAALFKAHENKKQIYHVEAAIPLESKTFLIHPDAYIQDFGSDFQQSVWGKLSLNVSLPRGGTICGFSDRITFYKGKNGKFESLQVFYEPDLSFYKAASVQDVFNYWKSKGKLLRESSFSTTIDFDSYVMELGTMVDGYITMTVQAKKKR